MEGKLSHSKDCRARDLTTFLVSLMQRELPDWEWDCDIENLHVSVFPYLSPADVSNLCFTDPKARAILLWDSPSVEFVKDYLSVVCMDFDPSLDPAWWRRLKNSLLPFKNPSLSDMTVGELSLSVRDFFSAESSSLLSASDWVYREAKDIVTAEFASRFCFQAIVLGAQP